jgi:hypothetical protein
MKNLRGNEFHMYMLMDSKSVIQTKPFKYYEKDLLNTKRKSKFVHSMNKLSNSNYFFILALLKSIIGFHSIKIFNEFFLIPKSQ